MSHHGRLDRVLLVALMHILQRASFLFNTSTKIYECDALMALTNEVVIVSHVITAPVVDRQRPLVVHLRLPELKLKP